MSARQDLIIGWTALGLTRKEMAFLLQKSLKTVEFHCATIRRKLGFSDPARLTHYALVRGLARIGRTV